MSQHFVNDLRAVFDSRSAQPALIYRDQPISYGELGQRAMRFAAQLQAWGLVPGDRVALFTNNKLPFLTAQLGVQFAGGVPLPLNPRFTREEMRYFLSDSEAFAVIAGDEQQFLAETLTGELVRPPRVVPDSAVGQAPAAAFQEPNLAPDDPCLMLYSSGTTGWPKGVVHTQLMPPPASRGLKRAGR